MERTDVVTRQGVIPLWAPPSVWGSARPGVLVITGAWADASDMIHLHRVLDPEGWDAAVMRLPGNETPVLAETSIAAWAAAVDELIGTVLSGRVVVPLGLSIGALVALALRAPEVKRIVALEPPLVMSKLWPMRETLQQGWRRYPRSHSFLAAVFGVVGEEATEERTWFHLFDGAPPVDVVLGGVPLMPPRELARYPSFVDEPERQWLTRRANVRTSVILGVVHNIHAYAPHELLDVLAKARADALA